MSCPHRAIGLFVRAVRPGGHGRVRNTTVRASTRRPRPCRPDPDLLPQPAVAASTAASTGSASCRPRTTLAGAAAEILALAVPVDCVCCGAEDLALCVGCERRLRLLTRHPFRAEAAGARARWTSTAASSFPWWPQGSTARSWPRRCWPFKRHGQGQLRAVLAKGLAQGIAAAAAGDRTDRPGSSPQQQQRVPEAGLQPRPSPAGRIGASGQPRPRRHRLRWTCSGNRDRRACPGTACRAARRVSAGETGPRRVRGSMRGPVRRRSRRAAGTPVHHRRRRPDHRRHLGGSGPGAPLRRGGIVRGAVVLAATRPPDRRRRTAALRAAGGQAAPTGDIEKNKLTKG